ncbi:hypothetical protein FGO68_gene16725 [Halteria grandinella]|uniref:Uncharacterized protein n=1 Tax=Halteria grandinella TaxID=5974 RepID=A0A8J8NT46_HALGN|nr:hypothetical protein FGO68_gene16725 [Halteria grandinella]
MEPSVNQFERQRRYRVFDWSSNHQWQFYYNNLYPIPAMSQLERIRRRWYFNNIDREFDISYGEPQAQRQNSPSQQIPQAQRSSNSAAAPPPQAQESERPDHQNNQRQANQQREDGGFRNRQQHDTHPELANIQALNWLFFIILIPFKRGLANLLGFAALILGLIRTYGFHSQLDVLLQVALYDENLLMLPYMGVTLMIGWVNFIMYLPLIVHGLIESGDTVKNYLEQSYAQTYPLARSICDQLARAQRYREQLKSIKGDLELYIGVYLLGGWFFKKSNLISILFYWQLLRIKSAMKHPYMSEAVRKLDTTTLALTNRPECPQVVRSGHQKLRFVLKNMADLDQMKDMHPIARSCAIF